MAGSLAGAMRDELLLLLAPLRSAASPDGIVAMLASFGYPDHIAGQMSLSGALQQLAASIGQLSQIDDATLETWDGLAQVLQVNYGLFTSIRSLEQAVTDPALLAQLKDLGQQIASRLLALYLRARIPAAYRTASILTLVEPAETTAPSALQVENGQIVRLPWQDDTFHFERFGDLINHPWPTLRDAYFPNGLAQTADAYASADRLIPLLTLLATELGLPCANDLHALAPAPDSVDEITYGDHFSDAPPENTPAAPPDDLNALRLQRMPRLVARIPGLDGSERMGILMTVSSREHPGGVAGLIFSLEGVANWSETHGAWQLSFQADGQIPAFVIGPTGVALAPVTGPLTGASASFSATRATTDGKAFLFGSATGTHVEVGTAQVGITAALSSSTQSVQLSAGVDKAALVIVAGDGDGFLKAVLPQQGLRVDFQLAILASSDGGFTIRGGAGLDSTIPVGVTLGPFAIPSIHLALTAGVTGLSFESSAAVSLSIGPLQAVIDRVGLLTQVGFPAGGGNLGVADFSLSFKPPSGVGLRVDDAGVSGGGFLGHDDAKHEYTGVLQLQFTGLALQAFALITTQAAGAEGYSLLAMIDADFPPVRLGWGFTLNGVGGLLAVHRTASVDALRAAIKADQLSTILFPKNAITNAPLILAQLDTMFPTAPGRFLFGPMALIGWGTPTLLTAALAIIIELPEPIRIILLARLAVRLPSESESLVRINMDALGVLDLGQDSLSLDATLFDSRLLKFALSGDMALRANWSGEPREFLLSVGGFHPRFTPPTGFPTLKRMSIDMSSGAIATLHLESYLAITSNTLQIGANLHVVVKVSAFSVDGHLGFDALFQRNPFHFDGDISGAVAVSIDGYDLLSVSLDATLTGPAPWNVAGKFKVHILFVDVHKSFSHTWGDDAPADQIAPVDVAGLLAAELADPRSWGAQLADGTPALV